MSDATAKLESSGSTSHLSSWRRNSALSAAVASSSSMSFSGLLGQLSLSTETSNSNSAKRNAGQLAEQSSGNDSGDVQQDSASWLSSSLRKSADQETSQADTPSIDDEDQETSQDYAFQEDSSQDSDSEEDADIQADLNSLPLFALLQQSSAPVIPVDVAIASQPSLQVAAPELEETLPVSSTADPTVETLAKTVSAAQPAVSSTPATSPVTATDAKASASAKTPQEAFSTVQTSVQDKIATDAKANKPVAASGQPVVAEQTADTAVKTLPDSLQAAQAPAQQTSQAIALAQQSSQVPQAEAVQVSIAAQQQAASQSSQSQSQSSANSSSTADFQLPQDSSVKVQSISYSVQQPSAQQGQTQSQTGNGSQQDILKDLLSRQSNYAAAAGRGKNFSVQSAASSAAVSESVSSSATTGVQSLATSVAGTAKGAAMKEALSQNVGENSAEGGISNHNLSFSSEVRGGAGANVLPGKALAQSSGSSGAELVSAIQEIVAKMPSALRGSNLDAKGNFTMDLSIDGIGQLKLSIERNGDKIAVNVQTGSDSGKEQLSGQRQELEREMRNLGYKDVSVDIGSNSSGDSSSSQDWRRNGSGTSNASSEDNVKLAYGDAKADLAEILGMNN